VFHDRIARTVVKILAYSRFFLNLDFILDAFAKKFRKNLSIVLPASVYLLAGKQYVETAEREEF
jgi:hypothetical protein